MPEIELSALRQELHQLAELAHHEKETSTRIRTFLAGCRPEQLVTGLGGCGLAAVFQGSSSGPRILLRCELDALPITEALDISYRSKRPAVSHKCGHDGHMAILAAVASRLAEARPPHGSMVLLFQPAEETGEGAARVMEDQKFADLAPDMVVALHNLPGFERRTVVVRKRCFAAASTGMAIALQGITSHAAEPERGRSPAMAMAQLITGLSAVPQTRVPLHEAAKVTIVSATLGEVAYGTTPGNAKLHVTIRAYDDQVLRETVKQCRCMVESVASAESLQCEIEEVEPFPATINDGEVVAAITQAARDLDLDVVCSPAPFGWSEDFGHFTANYPGALFGLGSGSLHPPLHHPDYDFPDQLIGPGADMLLAVARILAGRT